jgi:hypothetical protein
MSDSLSLSLDALIAKQQKPRRKTTTRHNPLESFGRKQNNNRRYAGHDDRTAINYNVQQYQPQQQTTVTRTTNEQSASIQSRKILVSNLHHQVTEKDVKVNKGLYNKNIHTIPKEKANH